MAIGPRRRYSAADLAEMEEAELKAAEAAASRKKLQAYVQGRENDVEGEIKPDWVGPQIIDNPFYVPQEPAEGEAPPKEKPYWMTIQEGAGSQKSSDQAKTLLAGGGLGAEHQKRLQEIVSVNDRRQEAENKNLMMKDTQRRKAAQGVLSAEYAAVVADNIKNPKTQGEMDEINAHFKKKASIMMVGEPFNLLNAETEKDNPTFQLQNVAKKWANDFKKDEKEIASELGLGVTKDNPLTSEMVLKWRIQYAKEHGAKSGGTPAERAAIKDDLHSIEAQMTAMEADTDYFEKDGTLKALPGSGLLGTVSGGLLGGADTEESWKAGQVHRTYNELKARRDAYYKRQRGFAEGYKVADAPGATKTADVPGAGTPDPVPAAKIGTTAENPVTVSGDTTDAEAYAAAQKQARSTNPPTTVYLRDRAGQVFPVR